MGNVTSADNDKVNELLTRRARKKAATAASPSPKQLRSTRKSTSSQGQSQSQQGNGLDQSQDKPSFFNHRQKPNSTSSKGIHPLMSEPLVTSTDVYSQADFYSRAGTDYCPLTPTSPTSFSSAPLSTSPSLNQNQNQILDHHSSQHHAPHRSFTEPLHSEPINISHRTSTLATSPSRLEQQQQQQQQQLDQYNAGLHLLGTSPEVKDWLKQKPTRSSTHMIHQYNFHPNQYYQAPGSSVKIGNGTTNRSNLTTYSSGSVTPLPRINTSTTVTRGAHHHAHGSHSMSNLSARLHSASISSSSPTETTMAPTTKPRPRSITAAAALMSAQQNREPHQQRSPPTLGPTTVDDRGGVPLSPSSAPSRTESESRLLSDMGGNSINPAHGLPSPSYPIHISPASSTTLKDPRVGKLVMSRSKLNSPSVTSLSSSAISSSVSSSRLSSSISTAGSSPMESTKIPPPSSSLSSSSSSDAQATHAQAPVGSETSTLRPSSTLSSLRSLLENHPQGLSLIESLEEDEVQEGEDDETETMTSLSDTETADSDADMMQRATQASHPTASQSPHQGQGQSHRRRPPPQFEWMAARKRFSSSTLSTISVDVNDSQKGQHALWKYIGGGNAHAPIRYDISRILDSGCGLGEWTMVRIVQAVYNTYTPEMAKEYPSATVYGVDINSQLFPSAHTPVPSNCLFTQANILNRLAFPEHYFDFCFQRFLYLGLTVDDWPVALKELHRVLKPGGWIELFEPSMRVHRAGPRTRDVMRWISRLLQEERGLDFDFAGERMQRLCESKEIGFENVKLERLSIPMGSWGGRVGEAMAENMVMMFQNLRSVLLEDMSQPRDASARKAFDAMVQSWVRECEMNKSYLDYYILVAQKPL
ncbi:hypothetical protein BGZ94_009609 [Podila epigama]|nr:hypothetical protein BGZ94_009609 [Podila epigama]